MADFHGNDETITDEHESYGTIQIVRSTGRFKHLFGSNIETNSAVHLTISEASRDHQLGSDWIHSGKQIVSLHMTELQFAQMITSMGQGDGTPVTLRHIQGKQMEEPPAAPSTARRVAERFAKDTADTAAFAKEAGTLVKDILGKGAKMKAEDRQKLESIFRKLTQVITDSGPFLMKQAEEAIADMVGEARATITQHAHALGVSSSVAQLPALNAPNEGNALDEGDLVYPDEPVEFEPETEHERDEAEMRSVVEVTPEEGDADFIPVPGDPTYEAPELPDLPEREIDQLSVADMNSAQVAERITDHLKRHEAAGVKAGVNTNHERALFFGAHAFVVRGGVSIRYISYQGISKITLPEAKLYLEALQGGYIGCHWKILKKR